MNRFFLSPREWLVLCGAGVGCLAAWLLPGPKPDAVAGRLGYPEFLLALLSSGLLLSVLLVVLQARPNRKQVAFRTAAVWLGTLGAWIAWETIVWLLPPRHPMDNPFYTRSLGRAGDELPFERPPHLHWEGWSRGDLRMDKQDPDPSSQRVTFVTDLQGFRNSEDRTQADLVFLGDSFTEAGSVAEEDTFVRQTAESLGWTARNLGRSGYTPPVELVVLARYALPCRPRAVVWQIAESNDLEEAVHYLKWVAAGRPAVFSVGLDPLNAWEQFSPSWRLFRRLRTPKPWPLRGTFRDRTGQVHEIRFLEMPSRAQSPLEHPGWPVMERSLREGAQLLRDRKIPLLLVLIPMKARGMGPSVELDAELQKKLGSSWDLLESQTLAAQLKTLCQELEVTFLDTTPALRSAAAAGEVVYLPFDTHLAPAGHQVVSAALVEAIQRACQ